MEPSIESQILSAIAALNANFANLDKKFDDMIEGNKEQLKDHEDRIRDLESDAEDAKLVKKIVFGAVGVFLLAIVGAIVTIIIRH